MPGMGSGLSDTNPTLVAAFRTALLHQGLLIALLLAVLALAWFGVREWMPGAASARSQGVLGWRAASAEPAARRLLRIGFGIIWIFDGLLQAQPAMAAGLPSQVMEPAAASSPVWVQHLVNWAGTSWSYHPIQAGAAAVWIQVGLGAWLVAAPSGWLSRLAGLASATWGLVVWVFAEAFGGIFAPGLTFLFGAPGAVLFYCAAGLLIALPEARWHSARLGRQILAGLGLFLAGMAVLQAWPGRGFWQGRLHGQPGTLADMVRSMAGTPQPHFLSALVSGFATVDESHGFVVNLLAVLALAAIGTAFIGSAFLTGRPRLIRPALAVMLVLCLADWVLIEDFGFLGGLGTDPNSMIPVALIGVAGYLALVRVPAPAPAIEHCCRRAAPRPPRLRRPAPTEAPAAPAPFAAGQFLRLGQPACRARPVGGCGCHRRCRADGSGAGQPDRKRDHRAGYRRQCCPAELRRARVHSDRSGRQAGQPRQPARQGRAAHLSRPGLHLGLPADRSGVQGGRPRPWC